MNASNISMHLCTWLIIILLGDNQNCNHKMVSIGLENPTGRRRKK